MSGDPDPVADAKRLLDLNRQPGEQIAERVLQREPDDDGADRGRGEDLLLQNQRRGDREETDDDGVLDDGRKAIGQPIDAPRIDRRARRAR